MVLVMPGGESTAMRRLIDKYGFLQPLKDFAEQNLFLEHVPD